MIEIEVIAGDVLTKARRKRGDVEMIDGTRGGVEFRAMQLPMDFYYKRRLITKLEYINASKLYRDFYISGQTTKLTCNLDAIRSDDQKAYLPATQTQREALDNWRSAISSIHGKIGQLMALNVCCYGYWLKDINYMPYNQKQSLPRFREALEDLRIFYDDAKKHLDRQVSS